MSYPIYTPEKQLCNEILYYDVWCIYGIAQAIPEDARIRLFCLHSLKGAEVK